MEITKSNFTDAFPTVKEAIEECTFLAIDTELTGLHEEYKTHAFDTMDERYVKMCETAKKFLIIQVGLSCFTYDEEKKLYTHKDFNFYVFPRQHSNQAPDAFFTCSASSLNFLMSYDFDFNKLIKDGISYLTPSQEQTLRSKLTAFHEEKISAFEEEMDSDTKSSKGDYPNVPDDHKEFIKGVHNKIEEYIASDSTEPLNLSPCTNYKRRLIYQTVSHKYPTGLSLNTVSNQGQNPFISVSKMSDAQILLQMKEKYQSEMRDLEEAVGFRKVLDTISETKKLVLGHNMLLDLFHMVNQFYFPVPDNLTEFKEMLKCIFPCVADTKTLASAALKRYGLATALFELMNEIESHGFPQPKIVPEEVEGFDGYTLKCDRKHEAGYDAYVTGVAFVCLTAKLAEDHKMSYLPPNHRILRPFVNRPYIMRHFDIQSLNLNGPDPEGKRENVFHIAFPKEWKTTDLIQLFQPFGEIHVCWVNDVSAFVALKSPEQTFNVRKKLLKSPSSLYKVVTYADYHSKQQVSKEPKVAEVENRGKRQQTSSATNVLPNRSISTIVEEEENEIGNGRDKQDNCVSTSHDSDNAGISSIGESPKPKRLKVSQPESDSHEVTSTDKLFKEPDAW